MLARSLVRKCETWVKVVGNDKRASLLHRGIDYCGKKFNGTGQGLLFHERDSYKEVAKI
jgi:hypothetical protein